MFSVERQFAVEAVRLASIHVARPVSIALKQRVPLHVALMGNDASPTSSIVHQTKDDLSPVTVADYAVQAVIAYMLHCVFPEAPLIAEESSSQLKNDPFLLEIVVHLVNQALQHYPMAKQALPLSAEAVVTALDRGANKNETFPSFWTLDPIDGTKGFLRGGQYAICLALIEQGQVQVAAVGCPFLPFTTHQMGTLCSAGRDQGAFQSWLDDESTCVRMHVQAISDAKQAVLCESFEKGHSAHSFSSRVLERLSSSVPEPVRLDSQCKYCMVARGEVGWYLRLAAANYQEKIWDHACGELLVVEAGGKVTDVNGKSLDWTAGSTLAHNRGILAAPLTIHDTLLAIVSDELTREDPAHL